MDKFPVDKFFLISFRKTTEGIKDETVGYAPYMPKLGVGFMYICKGRKEGAINIVKTSPIIDIYNYEDNPNYKTLETEHTKYDLWILDDSIPAEEVEEFIKDEFIKNSPELDMLMASMDYLEPEPKSIN